MSTVRRNKKNSTEKLMSKVYEYPKQPVYPTKTLETGRLLSEKRRRRRLNKP